ncbi:MAG: hypothetical protein JF887_00695 [Candidatus Dormibacteraeota bacterium]|uniref:RNA polymerase sigma-70 region 2 domain-containing protein n=1 Tax=Candidatus Amunia macphersoniae TaxID=3127014 RepID=A0A934KJN5_9BACT|nr:hypothetical protein [Candidatus Dormibacteraeota bacterium]
MRAVTQVEYVDVRTATTPAVDASVAATSRYGTRGFTGTPIDDERLVAELISRRPATLMQVYDRLAARVYAVALEMVGDVTTAEQLVEAAFLALWKSPESVLVERQSLRVFLCDAVRNGAGSGCRPVSSRESR